MVIAVFEEKRILFALAAFTSHLDFMPTPSAIKSFEKELAKYKTGKGSIQFPYDNPLPKALNTQDRRVSRQGAQRQRR